MEDFLTVQVIDFFCSQGRMIITWSYIEKIAFTDDCSQYFRPAFITSALEYARMNTLNFLSDNFLIIYSDPSDFALYFRVPME